MRSPLCNPVGIYSIHHGVVVGGVVTRIDGLGAGKDVLWVDGRRSLWRGGVTFTVTSWL